MLVEEFLVFVTFVGHAPLALHDERRHDDLVDQRLVRRVDLQRRRWRTRAERAMWLGGRWPEDRDGPSVKVFALEALEISVSCGVRCDQTEPY